MPYGPCVKCGATNYTMSMGGAYICPSCDRGNPQSLEVEWRTPEQRAESDEALERFRSGLARLIRHADRESVREVMSDADNHLADLAAKVRARLGARGELTIYVALGHRGDLAYTMLWRRDYGDDGLSDQRHGRADSMADALAKVLRWEDDADIEDAVDMAYAPQADEGAEVA